MLQVEAVPLAGMFGLCVAFLGVSFMCQVSTLSTVDMQGLQGRVGYGSCVTTAEQAAPECVLICSILFCSRARSALNQALAVVQVSRWRCHATTLLHVSTQVLITSYHCPCLHGCLLSPLCV